MKTEPSEDSGNERLPVIIIDCFGCTLFALLCLLILFFVVRRSRAIRHRKRSAAFYSNSSGVYENPDADDYSEQESDSYEHPGPEYSKEPKDEDGYDLSTAPYTLARGAGGDKVHQTFVRKF